MGRENRDSRTGARQVPVVAARFRLVDVSSSLVLFGSVTSVRAAFEVRGKMVLFSSTRFSLFVSQENVGPEDVQPVHVTTMMTMRRRKEASEGSNEHRFTPVDTEGPDHSGGRDAFPGLPGAHAKMIFL